MPSLGCGAILSEWMDHESFTASADKDQSGRGVKPMRFRLGGTCLDSVNPPDA